MGLIFMLKLKNIKKTYVLSSDMKVEALKGVSLNFRKNEFVSILGPSGCGKTTMLNIIGGLDKYTDGDLFISGRSTKNFNDRDWDVYRNHRIGFIFQSYNLIPHQTILGNVELALTIGGVSKEERQKRAMEALDKVGLQGQYNKKPNQLSGGQCQRVAIARALVNEPEILLADEPTGALDTVTSVQIMDLIKEIANEKLVIMVTHNPELAEQYSSRIVRLLDGEVIEDSNPYSEEEEQKEVDEINAKEKAEYEILTEDEKKKVKKQQGRAKMSFFTAFKLSARNLYSKLKRTIMVVIAGSIGIIGVSAVLAVSQGVNDYITYMQDDLLSGNPIYITETAIDYDSLINSSSIITKKEALDAGDWVNVNSIIDYLVSNEDALKELVYNNQFNLDYVNYLKSMPKEYYNDIVLKYGIDMSTNIYTDFYVRNQRNGDTLTTAKDESSKRNISLNAITELYTAVLEETPYKDYSSYITSLASVMSQGVSNSDYIRSQYDILSGDLPKNSNDVLIVLSEDQSLSDLLLAQLGYFTEEEFYNLIYKSAPDDLVGKYNEAINKTRFEYDELLNKKFTWYPNDVVYTDLTIKYDKSTVQRYGYNYQSNTKTVATSALPVSYGNGLEYQESEWTNGYDLNICGIVKPKSGISYGSLPTGFVYTEAFAQYVISKNIESTIAKNIKDYGEIYSMAYGSGTLSGPIGIFYNLDYEYSSTFDSIDSQGSKLVYVGESKSGILSTFMSYIGGGASSSTSSAVSEYANMKRMGLSAVGGSYLPTRINIYPNDFDTKELVTNYLDKWNSDEDVTFNVYSSDFTTITGTKTLTASNRDKIKYTDSVEIIITLIRTMINIVTYALVAFTALSLVVSTVMVAIITYVSVVERIKEIGVIRSLGGRKRDVSHLFNAETFIIGLSSGVFGVAFTYIIQLIANIVVNALSSGTISTIANLTPITAIVMILVSIVLTAISGIIPARSAARKDPVVALRTE